jgi:molybdate transport system substrate-binding protein
MKRAALLVLLVASFLDACGPATTSTPVPTSASPSDPRISPLVTPEPLTLTVYAAASLTDAFTEIGQNFEAAHPGAKVLFNFSGSQTLSTQLTQGAKADIFAPANHTEMDKMVAANLIQPGAPKDFATNQLLVILPTNNPASVQTLRDLARPGLKLVLADATVPAGKYARQTLDKMSQDSTFGPDFATHVLANVVSNETDVKQVVAKVQLGEADAGIAYISDAIAAPELKTIEIPASYNVIAKYPIAALENTAQSKHASDFIAFVLSTGGQAILKKWGFTPVSP